MMASVLKRLVLAFALFGIAAGGGGNCKGVCDSGYAHFEECLEREGCTVCQELETPESTDASCTCSAVCQECYDDVYNECGGCSDKTGYDFDAQIHPGLKARAESMGCGGAAQTAPLFAVLLTGVAIVCNP